MKLIFRQTGSLVDLGKSDELMLRVNMNLMLMLQMILLCVRHMLLGSFFADVFHVLLEKFVRLLNDFLAAFMV